MSHSRHRDERPGEQPRDLRPLLSACEVSRLEEVADLHRDAASCRTALEYLHQALSGLDATDPAQLPVAVRLHRKCADSALDLGDLAAAAAHLDQADRLLARLPAGEETNTARAVLRGREAVLRVQQGAYGEALDLCKRAFSALAVTDRHREVANVLSTMGVCHYRLGRLDKSREFYSDAVAAYRRAGDRLGVAAQYSNLALLAKNGCHWQEAVEWLEKALRVADEFGATHFQCRLLLNLGIVQLKRGHRSEARQALEKGLLLARGLGDRDRETKFQLAVGSLELQGGNLLRAEEHLLAGRSQAEQLGFWRETVIADEYLGDLQMARGDADAALANYRLGLERLDGAGGRATDLLAELRHREARALLASGRHRDALAAADAALDSCRACGELYESGFCLAVRGAALARLGRRAEAQAAFTEAIRTFAAQQLPHHEADALATAVHLLADEPAAALPGTWLQRVGALLETPERLRDDRQRVELLLARGRLQAARGEWEEALLTVAELEQALELQPHPGVAAETRALQRRLAEVLDSSYSGVQSRDFLADLVQLARDPAVAREVFLDRALAVALADVGDGTGTGCLLLAGGDPAGWTVAAARGLDADQARELAACIRSHLGRRWDRPAVLRRGALAGCDDRFRSPADGTAFHLPIGEPGHVRGLLLLLPDGAQAAQNILATLERLGSVAALLDRELDRAAAAEPPPAEADAPFGVAVGFLTRNRAMQRVLDLARTVAASDLTVLLQGETGTGKGLLARAVHVASPRRRGRFLAVNCAAIPESLLESELFGHMRGSFTGAVADKKGLLAEADGGTVFLDEIGKLPLSMQGKLLHFLDTRQVRPVGSNETATVDVRIICATKTDLAQRVREGTFLEDLYYRLSDFPIVVPPLRERPDDLPLLARHFVGRYARRAGIEPPGLSRAFLTALERYEWPGNVRELEKVLVRAVVLARGAAVLTPELLPFAPPDPAPAEDAVVRPLRDSLQRVERREIARALEATGGNKSAAARLLRISYPSLLKKIRQYGLGHASRA